ncbi:MAG: magnesium transporter [Sulfurimonas sp. RIFOXYD12_FULL_36_11]|nr:MAG: magnesium transporter [Sulfurimonas sp. RIFOXYD12_FULL_36_11]
MGEIHNLVDNLHLEDLRNKSHPSAFDENEQYDMLIIRLPIITQELETKSIGFVITHNNSYLYERDKDNFKELDSRFDAPYEILDAMIDELINSFDGYKELILDMEEMLYLNKTKKSFMKQWLKLKHNIARVERALMHASSTMNKAIEYYENNSDFPINHYIDLHEHLERTLRSATLQLSKLDYLYNFYSAQTNERMNHMIYTLTIISAIFLPLNLVVGFFGMNTSGLPFSDGSSGTANVIILILFLSILTIGIINFVRKKV